MATIKCSNEQLRLIQDSLELHSRIGIMQLNHLLYHPVIEKLISDQFTSKEEVKVGDDIARGEVIEIGKDYFKTKGSWGNGEEIRKWTDMENLKHCVDYSKYHPHCDLIRQKLKEVENLIIGGDGNINGKIENDWDSFDMIQVIRHEFWKQNEKRSNITVDSHVTKLGNKKLIEVEL